MFLIRSFSRSFNLGLLVLLGAFTLETKAQTIQLTFPKAASPYRFGIEEKELGNGVGAALGAIRSYDVDGGKCSLVVTSKSCYALTAAHCLKDMLTAQGKVDWQALSQAKNSMSMGTMKPGSLPADLNIGSSMKITYLKSGDKSRFVSEGVAKDLTPNQIEQFGLQRQLDRYNLSRPDGEPAATGVEVSIDTKRAKVVAIGHGFANRALSMRDFEPTNNHELVGNGGVMSDSDSYYKFVRESRGLDLADHALLKLSEENCTCVKTGELSESEDVIVAGFSSDAVQMSKLVKPPSSVEYGGSSVPYSYGDQCYSFGSQAEIFTRNLGFLGKVIVYTAAGWQLQQNDEMNRNMMKHLRDKIIVTNARAAPGASGGAMLNSKGQLVGVTTLVMQHASGQKSLGVRISEIKDQLRATVQESMLTDAFSCD